MTLEATTRRMIEILDERAQLEGCSPAGPYIVIVPAVHGPDGSDGQLYCHSCCHDIRGRYMSVIAQDEDDACHCAGCGCLLAYALSREGARRAALQMDDGVSRLRSDDRYHVARMIEACPSDAILHMARKMIGHIRDV